MWAEIIAGLAARSADVLPTLNPPASPDEIAFLEQRIAAPLPEAFKQYLAIANGQNDLGAEHALFEYNRFLPIDEIIETMDLMEDLFGDEEPVAHIAENRIQPVLWDRLWVPFAAFEGSPRLILDLHPGRNGVPGQILLHFPGVDLEADDTVIAPDFAEFSVGLLRDLSNAPTS